MGSRTWSAAAACLLLWCTFVSVFGSPVPGSNIGKNISEAITELSANCTTNPLLTLKEGSLAVCSNPPDLKVRLKCLGFLDVNRRLCALNSIAGFNLTERLRVEGGKPLTVTTLCNNEKAFTFASLPDFPEYEKGIGIAFMAPNRCIIMCSSDNFMDDSPNYFCKALYYGSVIIQNVRAEIEKTVKDEKPLKMDGLFSEKQGAAPIPDQSKPAVDQATQKILPNVNIDIQSPKLKTEESEKLPEQNGNTGGTGVVGGVPDQNPQITGNKVSVASPVESDPLSTKNEEKLHNAQDDKVPETVELKPPTADKELPDVDVHKQPSKNTEPLVEVKPSITAESSPAKPIDPVLSVDKPEIGLGPDQEDYDSQLPGIDDTPILGDGNPDDEERPIKKADTSSPERNERQFASNLGPDDYMDDEDGHFFPLFFSAVVMMALLYILYHNKNKIMGLLIEGRQAGGRRRNSRGHSYRRLDTLEQAISSNAPGVTPSKIIY